MPETSTTNRARIIAIWLECDIEIAPTPEDESFPTTGFESIGAIKQKSTTLEATDGESFELRGTGGHLLDIVETEGGFALKTTVVEPTKLYKTLGLSPDDFVAGKQKVKTHVVDGRYAARLSPKRVGGIGVEAPVTQISFKPGGSEEEGGSAELTFNFIKGAQDYWYERFKKAAPANP